MHDRVQNPPQKKSYFLIKLCHSDEEVFWEGMFRKDFSQNV